MSDLERLLKLAGREAQQVAQSPAVEREMKEAAPENKKMVCKDCGDEMGHPTSDCENSAYDKDGDHWIEIDVDGDGDADVKVAADMAETEVEEAVGDSAEPIYDLIDMHFEGDPAPVFDDLVRYLSGDQIAEFVDDFRRNHDLPMDDDMDEAEIDENAFNQAAAAAARAGKSEFEFGGKKHKTTMKKDTAHKLDEEPSDEDREKAMKRAFAQSDEPERGEKRKKVSLKKAPWEESVNESACGCCGDDPCGCNEDCSCKTESVNEAPTMDTTQMVIMMKNAGLSEEAIQTKLNEWANSPADASELEQTSHGEAYDFAQNVNLSLKRYLDAQDMKVQVSEHTVENMKALYESKKQK
jgi:hypothetical protein